MIDVGTAVARPAQPQLSAHDVSHAEWLAVQETAVADAFFANLTDVEIRELPFVWPFWARPKQLAPKGDWTYWLLLAGRGYGKTRTIVEWAKEKARSIPNGRGAIVAATAADARDVLIEGESGILAMSSPDFMPIYEPSKRRITWPNGSVATIFTADQPDRLREPH